MADATSLAGKLALVTGAGMGIGQGIALELARRGADVAVHYAGSEQGARETVAQIEALGRRSVAIQGRLGEVEQCRRVTREAISALGGLDILVNNAGVTRALDFLETPPEVYDEVFNLNMRGYFFCAQEAARAGAWRRLDHQHHVGPRWRWLPPPRRVRWHQGRDHRVHPRARHRACPDAHPGQRHRPRHHRSATLLRHPGLHPGVWR
jgi:NAD(P)-dependent dehydrogenase (short-subunit alcohol dehydrogenase family)